MILLRYSDTSWIEIYSHWCKTDCQSNCILGPPKWLNGKESACRAGEPGSICGFGRSPGEGNGNPVQHFSLGNPMDRGARWTTVYAGVTKDLDMTKCLKQQLYA